MVNKKIIITASLVLYNNNLHRLVDLLNSINFISKYFEIFIYIVDNSEKNLNLNLLKFKYIKIKYFFLNRNIGFGAGHNYALKNSTKSKYHLLLNPDIYFKKSDFENLFKIFETSKKTVAISGVLKNIDESNQFIGRKDPSLIKLFLRRFATNYSITNSIDDNYLLSNENIIDVDNLSGAFMLVKKNILQKIGLFDVRFFLYLEDFDLSRRLRQFGKLKIVKDCRIYHHRARGSYHYLKLFNYHVISLFKYKYKWIFDVFSPKNTRKKIFIISTSGFIIENFFLDHISYLSKKFDVKVLSPFNSFPSKKINNNSSGFIDFNIERKINLYQDIKSFIFLWFIFIFTRPDMIISLGPKSGFIGGLAGFLATIKLRIFIFQGQVWANKSGLQRSFLKTFDKLTAFFNNHLLSVSPNEKKYLYENNITKKNIYCLGSGSIRGIDIDKFKKNNNKHHLNKNFFTFAFIGRMNYEKGIIDLLRSFKILNKTHQYTKLYFIGIDEVGISKKKYKNVKFFPYENNITKVFNKIDCLVLPSYREALPITILESFASNVPVIASDIYGVNYIVKNNKSGLLFPPGDIKSLTNKMQLIVEDNFLRKNIIKNAFRIVKKNYSSKYVTNNYKNYINNIFKAIE
jgi:GT2 family glycosyltransferase